MYKDSIYQWESIMETFYLKDMQNSKLLNLSTVPRLLKDPRPHQVKQTQDESYINHNSFYRTVCALNLCSCVTGQCYVPVK